MHVWFEPETLPFQTVSHALPSKFGSMEIWLCLENVWIYTGFLQYTITPLLKWPLMQRANRVHNSSLAIFQIQTMKWKVEKLTYNIFRTFGLWKWQSASKENNQPVLVRLCRRFESSCCHSTSAGSGPCSWTGKPGHTCICMSPWIECVCMSLWIECMYIYMSPLIEYVLLRASLNSSWASNQLFV